MAHRESSKVTALFISRAEAVPLASAVKDYLTALGAGRQKSVALLYAPRHCFLARVENDGSLRNEQNKIIDAEQEAVFEARLFNESAELRWLNNADGNGMAVVLCESGSRKFFSSTPEPLRPSGRELVGTIEQTYLLWGKSTGVSSGGWTRFAEARIGAFIVPVEGVTANQQRAEFTAIEYLGEYEDGNIAVAEERLTGIQAVAAKEKQNG